MPTATETPSRYTLTDAVYETVRESKRVTRLSKGDATNVGTVHRVTRGHKFVTVFREVDGKEIQMWRVPLDDETEVLVSRRRQTQESRDADRRVLHNQAIETYLARFKNELAADKTNFQSNWDKWGEMRYDNLESMISAEQRYRLWLDYANDAEYHIEQGLDHVGAMELFVAQLKDILLSTHAHRGAHKSSNMLSNLMDDMRFKVIHEFIDQARWFGVQ